MPGTIERLGKRGESLDSYVIPFFAPEPRSPQLTEAPLPAWYVHREVLFWSIGSIASVALVIWAALKRSQRTERTITLTLGYLHEIEGNR
jgi:hypothetical protein